MKPQDDPDKATRELQRGADMGAARGVIPEEALSSFLEIVQPTTKGQRFGRSEIRLSLPYPDSDLFSDGKLRVVTVTEGMRP